MNKILCNDGKLRDVSEMINWTQNVSTGVNNLIMENIKSRRKKVKYFDCNMCYRNMKIKERLRNKLLQKNQK